VNKTIVVPTSQLYGLGGGYSAVFWHVVALRDIGWNVTVATRNNVHPIILNNWISGVPIRQYYSGMERQYYASLNIDHFAWAKPEAELNLAHVFFPQIETPPPDGVRLYSNSNYTAEHINYKWNRQAETLYIPIKQGYRQSQKEKLILHVSRFSAPSTWADKGHRQMIQQLRMYANHFVPNGWKMIFAGSLDPNQEGYLNELYMQGIGLPIEFVHNPTDENLFELYSRAAIYWHATGVSLDTVPSAQEHLGLTPLEASASGCVPIVFRSGGMSEVVIDRKTGLLFDDIRELGKFTIDISQNWSMWAGFSQQGIRWAERWQDYPAFVDRVNAMMEGEPIPKLPAKSQGLPFTQEDVTIGIPTYNNADMLAQCLESLQKTVPQARIIVVNNGDSIDDVSAAFPNVGFLNVGKNLGYAGAYKLLEGKIETPLFLMLNDDIVATHAQWLEVMLYEFNDSKVGVVGAKLVFPDGNLQHAGGVIDWNRDDIGYHYMYGMPDTVQANQKRVADFVTGACLLARTELFHISDYLLEGLNMEEADLCFEAKAKGYKVLYQPAAMLVHYEGQTKIRVAESEERVKLNRQRFREKWG